MDQHPILSLHFLMKTYGGYPDRWLEQDWGTCIKLLDVNSIIQNTQARERKRQKLKNERKRKSKKGRKRR